MSIVPTPASDRARFWAKVNKNGPVPEHRPELGPCWLWTAACFSNGYGAFRLGSKQRRAHVVSFEWHVGPTNGLRVCHHCDNPPCCNPSHLFLGTVADNARDAAAKGRLATGTRSGMHTHNLTTLTEDQVREIHRLYESGLYQWEIAGRFNISQTMVSKILRGDAWGHLSLPARRTVPKVTEADVIEIRRLFRAGGDRRAIAAQYGVSLGCVDKIKHRRTFRDIP